MRSPASRQAACPVRPWNGSHGPIHGAAPPAGPRTRAHGRIDGAARLRADILCCLGVLVLILACGCTPGARRFDLSGPSAPVRPDCRIRASLGIQATPCASGLEVGEVYKTGLGHRTGLKSKDVIVLVNEQPAIRFRAVMKTLQEGDEVRLLLRRNQAPVHVTGTIPRLPTLATYVIVEDRGLPGVAEIDDTYVEVVRRLGKPGKEWKANPSRRNLEYPQLGLYLGFSGSPLRCTHVRAHYPFLGQTRLGLHTDGRERDALRLYGSSEYSLDYLWNCRALDYGNGVLRIGITDQGDIAGIAVSRVEPK